MEAGLIDTTELPLADAIEQYIRHLEAEGRRTSTCHEAGFRLRPLIAIVGGPAVLLEDVTRQHIEQRLANVPSVSGKLGTLGRISAFYSWAVAAQLVSRDPTEAIKVVGKANKGKPTHTRVEARELGSVLWAAANGDDPVRSETASALLVMLYCGLREGEMLRLQVRDLDLDSSPPILSVNRTAKTATGIRDTEIPDEMANLLKSRIDGKEMTAWIWPSNDTNHGHRGGGWLRKRVKRYCEEAGVTVTCQHGLRATHGRLSREAGVTAHVIAAQLGHTNSRVTVESYIGPGVEAREQSRRALRVLQGGRSGTGA